MKKRFAGPLGRIMERHLRLQRSFGLTLQGYDNLLDAFDRYLAVHFPKIKRVSRDSVVGYLQTMGHLHSETRRHYLACLRQFCRFMFHLDPKTYIPEKRLLPPGKIKIRSHIFSESEFNGILQSARHLGPPGSLRPFTASTIFALLWVTGMRISEVLNLNLGDVDLETGVIHIRETKFYKSRLIPLSQSSVNALKRYRRQKARYGHNRCTAAPFFINHRGKRCGIRGVQHVFCDIVERLKIRTAQGRRPRIHDFRHSFATRWLHEFYVSGKDPTAYLPVLATYLGHSNIANTQVYLRPSLGLLRTAGEQFKNHIHQSGG